MGADSHTFTQYSVLTWINNSFCLLQERATWAWFNISGVAFYTLFSYNLFMQFKISSLRYFFIGTETGGAHFMSVFQHESGKVIQVECFSKHRETGCVQPNICYHWVSKKQVRPLHSHNPARAILELLCLFVYTMWGNQSWKIKHHIQDNVTEKSNWQTSRDMLVDRNNLQSFEGRKMIKGVNIS